MANLISNVQLEDVIGNQYDSAYIIHDATINSSVLELKKIHVRLIYYKSKQHFLDGKSPIPVVGNVFIVIDLLDSDIPNVSPLFIQTKVTDKLKEIFGENNVVQE